ncbi:hypothetical protein EV128_12216 [Rhizobium azibense]|nr:hypothetical protein EV128_12216 [Rhizobium azibense]
MITLVSISSQMMQEPPYPIVLVYLAVGSVLGIVSLAAAVAFLGRIR